MTNMIDPNTPPPAASSSDPAHAPATDKRWRSVEAAMRRNGYRPGGLIEAMHAVQRAYGYIDERAMRSLAVALRLPLSKVYGVATFYHFFQLKPKGRHTCVVCLGTACYIKGSDRILQKISADHRVKPGETSADGELSLLTARCVGACGLAPAVVMDDRVIGQAEENTIEEKISAILTAPTTQGEQTS